MDCQHDGIEKLYNSRAREASLADGAMFLKASLHGVKRKRGVWGGLCKHNLFVMGSERVYMGSVFAGRVILDVALHSLKKHGGWGGRRPPNLQTDCLHDGI